MCFHTILSIAVALAAFAKLANTVVIDGKTLTMDEAIIEAYDASKRSFAAANEVTPLGNDIIVDELDIILTPEQYRDRHNKDAKALFLRDPRTRWPNGIVTFFITNDFNAQEKSLIQAAMNIYHQYTCLTFRPVTASDTYYVKIQNGLGCKSVIGYAISYYKNDGFQTCDLGVGCRAKGLIVHELGHVIGFTHEHNRPDRDAYVRVYSENVIPGLANQFDKYTVNEVDDKGISYDYGSVMHYSGKAFSVNGQLTLQALYPQFQQIMGTQETLSFNDIKAANLMYDCAQKSRCPSKACPAGGFLSKTCECWCPGPSSQNPVTKC